MIRNRALRSIYCATKNESHKRRFLLEVNEQPCDIRPIASEGSTELRYLQSTKNLYEYMLTYGNDTLLYIKLLRGSTRMLTNDMCSCVSLLLNMFVLLFSRRSTSESDRFRWSHRTSSNIKWR
jgi:hypothetical protein